MKTFIRMLVASCGLAASVFGVTAQAQEIPVMSIQALSGPGAFSGVAYQNAIRLAFEEANQKSFLGAAKVKLIESDNASDKGQAINLANRAIDRERAVLVLGPTLTSDAVAVAPIFNEKKTPVIALGTANSIVATGPYVFKFGQSPSDVGPLVAKHMLEKTAVRKVALIFDRTNEGLIEYKNSFRDAIAKGGGTIATEEAVISSDTNFLPLVTKLKSLDIDGIYFATYPEQAGNLALQLRQAGLPAKVVFMGTIVMVSAKYMDTAGKAGEGTVAVSEFYPGMTRPMNKSFEAAYKAKFGIEPELWAANGYSAAQVALAALKAAGPNPDRQKVRDALAASKNIPIVVGDGQWNLNSERQPKFGAIVLEIKNGQFVPAQ